MRIRFQRSGPTATIILDSSGNRNALSRETIADLQEGFDDLHRDKSVRGVILTASGTTFCSGVDLKQWNDVCEGEAPLNAWQEVTTELQELLETMLRLPKPIVAAVDGAVHGAGLGLILASDLAIATPKSTFSSSAARHGLVSGLVAPLMQFRVGAAITSRILLHSAPVTSEEAYQWGLVQYLVGSDNIWAKGNEIIQDISKTSPEAIQMTKRLLNEMVGESTWTHLISGAAVSATICNTEAAREGLKAFTEKRDPKYL